MGTDTVATRKLPTTRSAASTIDWAASPCVTTTTPVSLMMPSYQVAVPYAHGVAGRQAPRELVHHRHRTMAPAGASDRHRKISLALALRSRHHEIHQRSAT